MIIQVRGTHGSGKTTTVREVMKRYVCTPHYIEGRDRPFGYSCAIPAGGSVWVPGSYENVTGGCDTISKIDLIFGSIKAQAEAGFHVLFEGILAQHSAPRVLELPDYTAIVLTTPVEECVRRVNQRRASAGKSPLESDQNIRKEWKSVRSSAATLKLKGVTVLEMDVDGAVSWILEVLR